MKKLQKREICARIAQLRVKVCGKRGKSAFAKKLRLSPSTYDYYEAERVPPADILVAIADLAEVDLRWLISGREPVGQEFPAAHPTVKRAAMLLSEKPNAAPALAAFLDILSDSLEFPSKVAPSKTGGDVKRQKGPPGSARTRRHDEWIPLLGRSAAGVPQFWSRGETPEGITLLDDLIQRHARTRPLNVRPGRTGPSKDEPSTTVQIVTLPEAEGDQPVQFVDARAIKSKHPDAFAVLIDGESMAPYISHGDLVVLSPSVPAEEGKAAVVQLANQIGVTCKLFRRSGDAIHLVPINEQFPPQSFPEDAVVWALRVLARIRPE